MFMYAMFVTSRCTRPGRAREPGGSDDRLMTTYGILVGAHGATLSVERTTGISRMYRGPSRGSFSLVSAPVALSAFITLITFSFESAIPARDDAGSMEWPALRSRSALGALSDWPAKVHDQVKRLQRLPRSSC